MVNRNMGEMTQVRNYFGLNNLEPYYNLYGSSHKTKKKSPDFKSNANRNLTLTLSHYFFY